MLNEAKTITTWDGLKELGFKADTASGRGLCYERTLGFGRLCLSAIKCEGKHFNDVIHIGGTLSTPRTLSEISSDLPLSVDSKEQLAALMVFLTHLNGNELWQQIEWVSMGIQHQDLLPWVAKQKAYDNRPQCSVQREWMRLALNKLANVLADTDDTAQVELGFDGSVLTIVCLGNMIPMPATGNIWQSRFWIPANKLSGNLPKRLMQPSVEVSVYEGVLRIGRNSVSNAKELKQ